MLLVNVQGDESRGYPFDKTLMARQLRELLSPADANMVEVEMLEIVSGFEALIRAG
jgi:hypothetical protein